MIAPTFETDISLKPYNSFGIDVRASRFIEVSAAAQLQRLVPILKRNEHLILGGGSNILFRKNYEGIVVKMNIPGMAHQIDSSDAVLLKAGAGVVWNDLVRYAVDHQFWGIENLALIPGTVGAAPIQNIGAYGVELMDVFDSCQAYDTEKEEMVTLAKGDCGFSYRDSVFKKQARGRFIICEVTLKLSLVGQPKTGYGAIQQELEKRGISEPSVEDMAAVVSSIRTSKLPDPSTIGNAGSFFKNPLVDEDQFQDLISAFPDLVHYPHAPFGHKLAAGWLIEQCGWKGKRLGDAGTWKNQALVLVNHGKATGGEVYALSEAIIKDVKEKFNVTLEREVNVL